jgi:RNA polymerase primary sigma factor
MNDHIQPSGIGGADEEIRWYLQDLAMLPTLSLRAEQDVIQHIVADPTSAEAGTARNQLIEANLRLVIRLACRYYPFGPEFADLIQEGNVALIKAAQHFDPVRSPHFKLFATRRVCWALSRVVRKHLRENHLIDPEGEMEPISPLRAAVVKALAHNAIDEQALALDIPDERCISLDVLLAEADTDHPLSHDCSPDQSCCHDTNNESNPDASYFAQERAALVSASLGELTTKERLILTHHYLTDPVQSLEAIGRSLHITGEHVRQLELRVLRKLRHPHHAQILCSLL